MNQNIIFSEKLGPNPAKSAAEEPIGDLLRQARDNTVAASKRARSRSRLLRSLWPGAEQYRAGGKDVCGRRRHALFNYDFA